MGTPRLVLIGEAPGGGLTVSHPLELTLAGSTGRNLCAIAGWDWDTYLAVTDRRNLFDTPMPAWLSDVARSRALVLAPDIEGHRILLLGARVARAFGVAAEPPYAWFWQRVGYPDLRLARIPHPSGLNRVWNDPAERARARAFLEKLL